MTKSNHFIVIFSATSTFPNGFRKCAVELLVELRVKSSTCAHDHRFSIENRRASVRFVATTKVNPDSPLSESDRGGFVVAFLSGSREKLNVSEPPSQTLDAAGASGRSGVMRASPPVRAAERDTERFAHGMMGEIGNATFIVRSTPVCLVQAGINYRVPDVRRI